MRSKVREQRVSRIRVETEKREEKCVENEVKSPLTEEIRELERVRLINNTIVRNPADGSSDFCEQHRRLPTVPV